jgi:hypothetical protein
MIYHIDDDKYIYIYILHKLVVCNIELCCVVLQRVLYAHVHSI